MVMINKDTLEVQYSAGVKRDIRTSFGKTTGTPRKKKKKLKHEKSAERPIIIDALWGYVHCRSTVQSMMMMMMMMISFTPTPRERYAGYNNYIYPCTYM
jgi:hypothetical protein